MFFFKLSFKEKLNLKAILEDASVPLELLILSFNDKQNTLMQYNICIE